MKKIYILAIVLIAGIAATVSLATCSDDDNPIGNLGSGGSTNNSTLSFIQKGPIDYRIWVGDPTGGKEITTESILPENVFGQAFTDLSNDENNKMLSTYTFFDPYVVTYTTSTSSETYTYEIVADTIFVQGSVFAFGGASGLEKHVGLLHYMGNGSGGATLTSNVYTTLEQGLANLGYADLSEMVNVGDTIAIYNVGYIYQP